MSSESTRASQNSAQDSGRWFRWGWGTQFTVALTGTVTSLIAGVEGIFPPKVIYIHSNAQVALLGLSLLWPLIVCAFFLWTLHLAWKQRFFLTQWRSLPNRERAWFAAVFLCVGTLDVAGQLAADHLGFAAAGYLARYRFLTFWLCWTAAFCWVAHRNAKRPVAQQVETSEEEAIREKKPGPLRRWWLSVNNRILAIWLFNLVLLLTLPRVRGWSLFLFCVISLVMLMAWAHSGMQAASSAGRYGLALWLSNLMLLSPTERRKDRGWIFLAAGRFKEAQQALRPLAFDRDGKPNLTSYALYFYATALMDDGEEQAAEKLLEAAVQAPQETKVFHFGLADCLLTQGKDPERARRLAEEVRMDPLRRYTPDRQFYLRRQCVALEAWSLALEGRRESCMETLHSALDGCERLNARDLAGLLHLKGVTLAALGEREEARNALREALAKCSNGWAGVMVRRSLAELEDVTL